MRLILLFIFVFILGCAEDKEQIKLSTSESTEFKLKYAKGFKITANGDYKVLEILNPWPNSDKTYRYALINRKLAARITLPRDAFDGIILTPVEKLVATSTTHLPALELLEQEKALVGFPETSYVSSIKIRDRIDNGYVKELGQNENINSEILLELNPEMVVAFGVNGSNKILNEIKKANIPVIYNGDWVEKSPLAKAEWIKFFGHLFEKEVEADSIFQRIENSYIHAKTLASKAKSAPTVLSGAMHRDVWYLPSGASPEAHLFRDANINYLWRETISDGSLELGFEHVLEKAKDAEIWFSPSHHTSYEDLIEASNHYSQFKAFKNKNIYTFANTKGKTGGVLYYEMGIARPDLVLKDLIRIAHPKLLLDYETQFFKPLQ